MGYEVEIHGVKVKVTVAHEEGMIDTFLSELEEEVLQTRVVGFDIKCDSNDKILKLVILFVGTRCLIFQLVHANRVPDSLKKILADERICFVGKGLRRKASSLSLGLYHKELLIGIELDVLVARVRKNPDLLNKDAITLACEVGLKAESFSPIQLKDDHKRIWGNIVFSVEQIVYAIQKASASYLIGKKTLNDLETS
ncbi:hypothetical protein ACFE04_025599 [Oxalis oulophora]